MPVSQAENLARRPPVCRVQKVLHGQQDILASLVIGHEQSALEGDCQLLLP